MSTMNRLANCHNRFQGKDLKVLCVCSAGLLRSPTTARVLHRKFNNVNSRAVGHSSEYALIPLEHVHVEWADIIISADLDAWDAVNDLLGNEELGIDVKANYNLDIPDRFGFGVPELEEIILNKLQGIEELKCLTINN